MTSLKFRFWYKPLRWLKQIKNRSSTSRTPLLDTDNTLKVLTYCDLCEEVLCNDKLCDNCRDYYYSKPIFSIEQNCSTDEVEIIKLLTQNYRDTLRFIRNEKKSKYGSIFFTLVSIVKFFHATYFKQINSERDLLIASKLYLDTITTSDKTDIKNKIDVDVYLARVNERNNLEDRKTKIKNTKDLIRVFSFREN